MNVATLVPRWLMWGPTARPPEVGGALAMIRPLSRRSRYAADTLSASSASTTPTPFSEAVLLHLDAAYNLARFLTRDTDTAEDLVQEAVLKAHRGFSGFRGGDSKAWLLTIVRREVIDWSNRRRDAGQVFSDADIEAIEGIHCDEADPEHVLLKKGDISLVRETIERLPELFRECIILRELEELSYREVAQLTGVPIGTVMSRLARGRELLAKALRSAPEVSVQPEAGR